MVTTFTICRGTGSSNRQVYNSLLYRLTVQYVADHWVTYKAHRLSCGDMMASLPQDVGHGDPRYSLNRLQLEFDQFVLRATKWILTAHKYDYIMKF